MSADLDHRPPMDPTLHAKLLRWVEQSLITPTEADAIETFEARRAEPTPRRVPLLTEALAYVGAALAGAAAAVLLGERWNDLTPAVRAASVGTAFVVTLAAGWVLRRNDEPAIARLTSVLWAVATGLFGWLAWLIAYDVLDHRGRVPALVAGVAITALASPLYAMLRKALQQVGLFAGLLTIVGSAFGEGGQGTAVMVPVWIVAVAWVVLGGRGVLPPKRVAFVAGPLVALWAPMAFTNGGEGAGMWLGLATATALIVAGVTMHEPVLLGFGAVGVFGYLIRVLVYLFGDTAGMPVALLVAGAAVLAVAVGFARRSSSATRSARRSPS